MFAKRVILKKVNGEEKIFEVGVNNVKEISIFQNNNTVRIDFEDNAFKIFQFKDYYEVTHIPLKRSGLSISPMKIE